MGRLIENKFLLFLPSDLQDRLSEKEDTEIKASKSGSLSQRRKQMMN